MPRPLLFSKKYLENLLNGKKLSTVRVGYTKYKPGDIVLVFCGGLVLGRVKVVKVERKKFVDFTEEDARRDGFNSLHEFRKALMQHYPHVRASTLFTVLHFEWMEKYSNLKSVKDFNWNYTKNPLEVARISLENLHDLNQEEREILEAYLKAGSVRGAAKILGGLSARMVVRSVLRNAAERLVELKLLERRNWVIEHA
ncbi:MAG: ASCH domain-containing protein [Thermofilaceae archaeon]|nr:ASCH domain-containing protein [Thermofilaceae archaeon]